MTQPLRPILIAAALAITTPVLPILAADAAKPVQNTAIKASLAPEFSAKSVQGGSISSRTLAGKGYIVNFFGSWCPYCRKEIPDMVALQQKYEKQGFTFVGMAFQDNEQTMPDFIWQNNINYPIVMADEAIRNSFSRQVSGGVRSVPTLFAINRDGRLIEVITGARTKEAFETIILKTLKKPAR
ncbi:MAG: TlpA family protein disulfide reductase [Chlorobium sp.]|uniref:TlpA family protein disulfide reductase n=1 Tax=Chlorobium sp. TaxID=1095 RepID=UPI0025C342E1|nr:TlpA disulfide reductase family protein [Chlorobium sp.]MCF8216859.1 TlpA family protein disulfide reductase [Chlorobium sp.]MCF8270441.1 TlpA family protein disulfide reductase [Chlorobium sp.]MCF8288076.1 TlpA family protein disulfide reductase [Chlorobium sp.]MCF8290409.1 TlpA family protein disulfide reductase [Chlorobium sp.]MCF8384643.1 TlpA family protein disulfide reductase [Chlorobium sp.]